jgi:hypothetical protein
MRIEKITGHIYYIEQYEGRLTGTEVQRILSEETGTDFPVEEWSIRITTTSVGNTRISSALRESKRGG